MSSLLWCPSFLFLQFLSFLFELPSPVQSIRCYECTSGPNDWTCSQYAGTSCGYGFFGCIKVVSYDGGVDKMGNFIDDPSAVVSMVRGCNILPLGGVDACQQQGVLGYRVITCYCYSDYCNGAMGMKGRMDQRYSLLLIIKFFVAIAIIYVPYRIYEWS